MPGIGSLIVDMQLQIAQFVSNSAQIHKSLKGFEKAAHDTANKISGAFKGIGSTIAGYFAFRQLYDSTIGFAERTLDAADSIKKLSESMGVSVESLSGFVNVGELAGASMEDIGRSAKKLNDLLVKGASGDKEALRFWKAVGIDPGTPGNIKNATDAMLELSDVMSTVGEGALRAQVAAEGFGDRVGPKLIPLLKGGSESLREMMSTMRALGLEFSTEFADKAERFNDAVRLIGLAWEGFKRKFVIAAADVLTAAAEAFAEMRVEAAKAGTSINNINADPIKQFAIVAVEAIAGVLDALERLGVSFTKWKNFDIKAVFTNNLKTSVGELGSALDPRAIFGKLREQSFADVAASPAAALSTAVTGSFKDAFGRIENNLSKQWDDLLGGGEFKTSAQEWVAKFRKNIENPKPATTSPAVDQNRVNALTNYFAGDPKKGADQALKNAQSTLDTIIKALERDIADAAETLQDRLGFLQEAFQQNFLAIDDYYERRRNAQQAATGETVAALEKEIAALNAFAEANRKTFATAEKQDEYIKLQERIEAAVDKLAGARRKAAVEDAKLWNEQQKSAEAYRKQIEDVETQILELEGKTAEAARRRFVTQQEDFRKRLNVEATSEANTPAQRDEARRTLESLKKIEEVTVARAQLNEINEQTGIIQDQLRNKEELLEVARKRGTIGELALLRESDAARKEAVAQLQAQADIQERLALSQPEGPIRDRAIQNVRNFKVEIEKLAASSDQLRDKFDQIAENAFSDFLTEAIQGTKSLKDAFKDMVSAILTQINRLAAQEIAGALFGKDTSQPGGGTSFGSIVSGIFGSAFNFGGRNTPQPGSANFVGPVQPGTVTAPSFGSSIGTSLSGIGTALSSGFDKFSTWIGSFFHTGGIVGRTGVPQRAVSSLAFAPQFHTGGVVGVAPAPMRAVNAAMFDAAPRFHGGGVIYEMAARAARASLAPDEVPAVLKRGEEVLTRDDPRHVLNDGKAIEAIVASLPLRTASAAPAVPVAQMHGGGVVHSTSSTRTVSPMSFYAAPKFHDGGMATGLAEVPAILRRGAEVATRSDARRESSGDAVGGDTNIFNFSFAAPTDTSTQQQLGRVVSDNLSRARRRNG